MFTKCYLIFKFKTILISLPRITDKQHDCKMLGRGYYNEAM